MRILWTPDHNKFLLQFLCLFEWLLNSQINTFETYMTISLNLVFNCWWRYIYYDQTRCYSFQTKSITLGSDVRSSKSRRQLKSIFKKRTSRHFIFQLSMLYNIFFYFVGETDLGENMPFSETGFLNIKSYLIYQSPIFFFISVYSEIIINWSVMPNYYTNELN